jgi:signal transduction histidine kinase
MTKFGFEDLCRELFVVSVVSISTYSSTMNTKPQYFAAACLLAVFTINIFTPPDYIIDILYLCSIVLVFKQRSKVIIAFSAAACSLILLNAILFDLGPHIGAAIWINRSISVFAILVTSYIAIHYRLLNRSALVKEQLYAKSLEDMIFITSHQVRKPVANIIGLVEDLDPAMSAAQLKQHYRYLRASALELDGIIRELNAFMEQADQNHQASPAIAGPFPEGQAT